MDQETIQKYCDRFETTPEADIPNAVIFEAIAVGLKSKVRYEINRVNKNLLSANSPTPYKLALNSEMAQVVP